MNRSTHRLNVPASLAQHWRVRLFVLFLAAFLSINAAISCPIVNTEEYVMDSKLVYIGKIVEIQSEFDPPVYDPYMDDYELFDEDEYEDPEDGVKVYYIIEPVSVLRTTNGATPNRMRIEAFYDTKKSFETNLPNLMNDDMGREVVLIVNESTRTNEEWTMMRDMDSLPEIEMILDEINAVDTVLAEF